LTRARPVTRHDFAAEEFVHFGVGVKGFKPSDVAALRTNQHAVGHRIDELCQLLLLLLTRLEQLTQAQNGFNVAVDGQLDRSVAGENQKRGLDRPPKVLRPGDLDSEEYQDAANNLMDREPSDHA